MSSTRPHDRTGPPHLLTTNRVGISERHPQGGGGINQAAQAGTGAPQQVWQVWQVWQGSFKLWPYLACQAASYQQPRSVTLSQEHMLAGGRAEVLGTGAEHIHTFCPRWTSHPDRSHLLATVIS